MSTEIVMTKTTMGAIRERMLALGFTEHSDEGGKDSDDPTREA